MPDPTPPLDLSPRRPWFRLSPRALLAGGIAFAVGMLLFLGFWVRDRGNDFYRAQAPVRPVEGQQFEALPAPLPAGSIGNASGMGMPRESAEASSPMIESPRMPLPPPPPLPPPARSAAPTAMASGDAPVPIQSPAPLYPPDALRRGESGTVLLRVHVGPDGVPVAIDLVRSSRSRALDRAATEAVRRWRFRPAQRDGQAVNGAVQIPIAFSTQD